MKRLAFVLPLTASVALAAGAVSAITLTPSAGDFSFVSCASGGSSSQTVPANNYLVRITTADTVICQGSQGASCATGGQPFPSGAVMYMVMPGGQVSCRSAGTGNLYLTAAR